MEAMETCYKLKEERSNRIFFLFPSLAELAGAIFAFLLFIFQTNNIEVIQFIHSNEEGMQRAGLQYKAPQGMIFVSGFFGHLVVSAMKKSMYTVFLFYLYFAFFFFFLN